MTNCTCPSGDGSLRWPCPVHPPASQSKIDKILRALDHARGLINQDNPEPPYYTYDYVSRAMQFARDIRDELVALKAGAPDSAEPVEWRKQIQAAINLAKVFDDDADGADAESARSVVEILSQLLAQRASRQIEWIQYPDITDMHDDVLTDRGKKIRAAQLDADKVDAERYRAWRDAAVANSTPFVRAMRDSLPAEAREGKPRWPTADEWDTAVDAARTEVNK